MNADIEGDVGPPDVAAMEQVQELFVTLDGLVEYARFDSLLDPTALRIRPDDGIGDAGWCRFDVRWFQRGYYSIHHTDENDLDFRFDHHPKPDAPERHFHHPPDAAVVEQSCIDVDEPELVTRAVHKLWRRAYETGKTGHLNAANNPP